MFGRFGYLICFGILALILSGCNASVVAQGMELSALPAIKSPTAIPSLLILKHTTPTATFSPPPAIEAKDPPALAHPSYITPTSMPLAAATSTPAPHVILCSPLADFPLERLPKLVSAPYDPPPAGSDARHQGVDFVYHRMAGVNIPILGVQVNAVLPGIVAAALDETFPYGNLVIIETPYAWLPATWPELFGMDAGQSLYLLYAHLLETPMVRMADAVVNCQPLGKVGHSGNTEAAHLHLETRVGPSSTIFPAMFGLLAEAPSEGRKNYTLWRTSGVFRHFNPMLLLLQPVP